MIEYDSMLYGITECFSDALVKSDGTPESMLSNFNVLRFKRLSMLDPKQVYLPHASLLNKLHSRSNWKHDLHHEVLRAKPRSVQRGVMYLDNGTVASSWNELDYVSVLVQNPQKEYLFIKLDYHNETLCIDRLYACKVTKINDHAFQLYSVEGRVEACLDLLYSFSR